MCLLVFAVLSVLSCSTQEQEQASKARQEMAEELGKIVFACPLGDPIWEARLCEMDLAARNARVLLETMRGDTIWYAADPVFDTVRKNVYFGGRMNGNAIFAFSRESGALTVVARGKERPVAADTSLTVELADWSIWHANYTRDSRCFTYQAIDLARTSGVLYAIRRVETWPGKEQALAWLDSVRTAHIAGKDSFARVLGALWPHEVRYELDRELEFKRMSLSLDRDAFRKYIDTCEITTGKNRPRDRLPDGTPTLKELCDALNDKIITRDLVVVDGASADSILFEITAPPMDSQQVVSPATNSSFPVTDFSVSPDGRVFAFTDETRVWIVETPMLECRTLVGPEGYWVYSPKFSKDGQMLAALGMSANDHRVSVLLSNGPDFTTFRLFYTVDAGRPLSLCWTQDSECILVGIRRRWPTLLQDHLVAVERSTGRVIPLFGPYMLDGKANVNVRMLGSFDCLN